MTELKLALRMQAIWTFRQNLYMTWIQVYISPFSYTIPGRMRNPQRALAFSMVETQDVTCRATPVKANIMSIT